MRAVLDNATLTAGFRATGLIKNPNRDLFDLDVSALRVLVDNIILSNEIHILDVYKPEYKQQRKEWLSYDFITFHDIPESLDLHMLKNARAHVYNWQLSRHLATDLSQVFDDLSILFRHAWRGSEAFLVLKAYGIENKYNNTITKSLIEFLGTSKGDRKQLKKFAPKHYNRETLKLAQAVSWAAIRTVYYREASKWLGCEYISHPLRNIYNAKCILFDNHPHTRKNKIHSAAFMPKKPKNREEALKQLEEALVRDRYFGDLNKFFKYFWQTCNEKDDNIFGVQTFDIDIPPFLAYVLSKSNGRSIINTAIEFRNGREATSLRKFLQYIYYECNEDDRPKAIRQFAVELRDLKERLQLYLGYSRERVGISAKLVSYNFTVPRFMTKPLYPHKPHLAFIRDVICELASVGSMGRLIDLLWVRCQQ